MAWMEKMEKDTNGRVHFTAFWGGTLIQHIASWSELLAGSADISKIQPAFFKEQFPLFNLDSSMYYGAKNDDVWFNANKELRANYPQMDAEFKEAVFLAKYAPLPASTYYTNVKRPLRTLEDFKGAMIRVVALRDVGRIKALGGSPQHIPVGDMYMAIQKGMIDGGIGPIEQLKGFKLAEVTRYYLNANDFNTGIGMPYMMNMKSWNNLPADIQEVFIENRQWYEDRLRATALRINEEAIQYTNEMGEHEWFTLSDEDQAKYDEITASVVLDIAQDADKKGLPGTKLLNEAQALVAKYNAEIK
ncbi:TRAP transporter substrate-binding protein [Chloroflexota bacterium]